MYSRGRSRSKSGRSMRERLPDEARVMEQRREEEASFLNVDLDIEAPYDLAPLVSALRPQVFDLYTGALGDQFQTHLELNTDVTYNLKDPDVAIQSFITLLEQLPHDVKLLWDGATKRDFNIGIQGGTKRPAFECALLPQTLASIARLGARVVITVYPVHAEHLS